MNENKHFFRATAEDFRRVPGSPAAYWLSEKMRSVFLDNPPLNPFVTPSVGIQTGDNDKFIRFWWEVVISSIWFSATSVGDTMRKEKYYPYNKGGTFRKWEGNREVVVNWRNDGADIRANAEETGHHWQEYAEELKFKPLLTWTRISGGAPAFRYKPSGFLCDMAGFSLYPATWDDGFCILGMLNSAVGKLYLNVLAPTVNIMIRPVTSLAYSDGRFDKQMSKQIVGNLISLSCSDWDSYETSWDFKENPLVAEARHFGEIMLSDVYEVVRDKWAKATEKMRELEIRNNEIFIHAYGLEGELSPDVPWNEVSLTCNPWYRYGKAVDSGQWAVDSGECAVDSKGAGLTADHSQLTTAHFPLDTALEERLRADTAKELVSYAVGCMMGRYSLDRPGLAFAGGEWSGQWAEISGRFYLKEVVENHVREELQRIGCLAEGDGSRGRDIPTGETPAQGGVVRPVGSDAQSGGVDSVEHRRGTSKKLYEGIRELPVDGKRFEGGIGNAAYDLCSPEILDAITSGNGDRLVRRGWQDAVRVDWEALRARISGQSAAHSPLSTAHSASGFTPDADGILPILDADWFEDDIVTRLHAFLRAAFGEASFHANVAWLEEALGKNLRSYFVKDFYADHVQRYQKRPIYWLFSSRKGAFQALVYLHRYRPDTPGRVLGYLRSYIAKVAARIEALDRIAADPSAARGTRTAALRERTKLAKAQAEIADYERDVLYPLSTERPALDLDDGVKANYPKLGAALRKIF